MRSYVFPAVILGCAATCAFGCAGTKSTGGAGGSPGSGGVGQPGGGAGGILPRPPDAASPETRPCAEQAYQAETVPVNLMVLMDRSGSMIELAGTKTKWETAQGALTAFVKDPKSAGLGVGLQFFPVDSDKLCNTDADCLPVVGFGTSCNERKLCVDAAGLPGKTPPAEEECGPSGNVSVRDCPNMLACVPLGRCPESGADCANIGGNCPMGGGVCTLVPKTCRAEPQCEAIKYEKLEVDIGRLPAAELRLTQRINNKRMYGGTPTRPAVEGVLNALRRHATANPGHKAALILVTDGQPGGCTTNMPEDVVAVVRQRYMGTPSITTYAVGVSEPAYLVPFQLHMDMVAQAGGSGKAIVLTATADLAQKLQEAFNTVRGMVLPCEYTIPTAREPIDFTKGKLLFTGGAGPEDIAYVRTAAACDASRGGWYYDIDPTMGTPTRVLICPVTCGRFKSEPQSKVNLSFDCASIVIP